MKTKLFSFVTLLLIITVMNSCSKSNSYMATDPGVNPSPGANEVWMQNTAFNPPTRTVMAGTTVMWTNKDVTSHDVTSNTGLFTSPALGQNGTFSFTFTTAGTYTYHCTFHAGMNGTIIVQ